MRNCIALILTAYLFALSPHQAGAQTFTFECICGNIVAPDCDVCNGSIQSRYFSGIYIKKNGVGFKWIDAPYIIKWQGQTAVISEIVPSAESISIARSGTAYGTLDSFKMALDCRCGNAAPLWWASDSINITPVYKGDTVIHVGNGVLIITLDSLTQKYVHTVDTTGLNNASQVLNSTSDATSHTATLSLGGGSLKLIEGANITLTTGGTGLNGEVTIASSGGSLWTDGGVFTYLTSTTDHVVVGNAAEVDPNYRLQVKDGLYALGAGGTSATYGLQVHNSAGGNFALVVRDDTRVGVATATPARTFHVGGEARITDLTTDTPTLIVGADGDGDLGAITVGSGLNLAAGTLTATAGATDLTFTGASSPVTLNSSTGTDVTFTAGGINSFSATGTNITITGTEVDGSVTNEAWTIDADDADTEVISNQTVKFQGGGLVVTDYDPAIDVLMISATEVDGSTSNELQTFANTSNATTHTVTLSNSGGSVQLIEGANITLTTGGTGLDGTVTIASTGGAFYQLFLDDGAIMPNENVANFVSTATVDFALTDDPGNLETEVRATVPNDAITYAKIQNAAANNVLLGNNNGAGTDYEELNAAAAQTLLGYIDGAGVATRIAYWTDANTLSNDAAYTVDDANDRMTITGTVVGTGANNAWLNLNGGSLGGDTEAFRASANISTEFIGIISNVRNTANTGNAKLTLSVGGTAGGDPYIAFVVPSGSNTVMGNDNSDGDKFKITPGGQTPGSVANAGLIITQTTPRAVGINLDAPIHPLDVAGVARAAQFRNTGNLWAVGNVAFGTGAGTGPTVNSISGGNNFFQVTFTTGTAPTANGVIMTLTYPNAYGTLTYPVLHGRGDPSGVNYMNEEVKFNVSAGAAASFTIKANGTLTASTIYGFSVGVGGY